MCHRHFFFLHSQVVLSDTVPIYMTYYCITVLPHQGQGSTLFNFVTHYCAQLDSDLVTMEVTMHFRTYSRIII